MYKVYILKTDSKERYYIGHSEDVEKRLSEHNSAKTKSTKAYVPWKIIYTEEYQT
ncbi:MAG: GIY-YIG nuclease family protein, partial [Ignavibacteriales bacterium]